MTGKIYRSMLADDSGLHPRVGCDKNSLGVVVQGEHADVTLIDGMILTKNREGMSVAPAPCHLPSHRIPRRLRHIFSDARSGQNTLCWRYRDQPFEETDLTSDLALRIDHNNSLHGLMGPAYAMNVDRFIQAWAETPSDWVLIPWRESAP